jgi:hypothetical protein
MAQLSCSEDEVNYQTTFIEHAHEDSFIERILPHLLDVNLSATALLTVRIEPVPWWMLIHKQIRRELFPGGAFRMYRLSGSYHRPNDNFQHRACGAKPGI